MGLVSDRIIRGRPENKKGNLKRGEEYLKYQRERYYKNKKEKEMKLVEEALRNGIEIPKKMKKIVNKFDKMEIVRVD